MVMEFIMAGIVLIALSVASYTDLKTREVPDWLSYGLIAGALSLRSIFTPDIGWPALVAGILGLGIMFILACLLYYTGQWGGGDSKLLMGMGAAIGVQYPFGAQSFALFWYFLGLLFLGAIYGVFYMLWVAAKKGNFFWSDYRKTIAAYGKLHLGMWVASLWIALTGFFLPFLWYVSIIPIGLFYLLFFVDCVEETCFVQKRSVKNLTEGDWLAEDVRKQGKTLLGKKTLEMKDLALLRRVKIGQVIIKEGIPFVPSFLLAYLFFLWAGELMV